MRCCWLLVVLLLFCASEAVRKKTNWRKPADHVSIDELDNELNIVRGKQRDAPGTSSAAKDLETGIGSVSLGEKAGTSSQSLGKAPPPAAAPVLPPAPLPAPGRAAQLPKHHSFPITADEANKLAKGLLHSINEKRHAQVMAYLSSQELYDKVDITHKIFKRKENLLDYVKRAVEEFKPKNYIEAVKKLMTDAQGYDTVAVTLSENNELTIAANIRTRKYQNDISSTNSYQIMLDREMNPNSKTKQKTLWMDEYVQGLRQTDYDAIREYLQKSANPLKGKLADYSVLVITPIEDALYNQRVIDEFKIRQEKKKKQNKGNANTKKSDDPDAEFQGSRWETYKQNAAHSEQQLYSYHDAGNLLNKKKVLLGVSKPQCLECYEVMKAIKGTWKFKTDLRKAAKHNTIWMYPEYIALDRVPILSIVNDKPVIPGPSSSENDNSVPSTNRDVVGNGGRCVPGTLRRRRREHRSCFYYPLKKEINSREFYSSISRANPEEKELLMDIISTDWNGAKLTGEKRHVDNVRKFKQKSNKIAVGEAVSGLRNQDIAAFRHPNVRLSPTRVYSTMTKFMNSKIVRRVGTAAGIANVGALAQTIIVQAVRQDYAGLAMTGGFVAAEPGIYYGARFLSRASFVGSRTSTAFRIISRQAGPIMTTVSSGISIWRLASVGQGFSDLTNEFDQQQAVNMMVHDGINIAYNTGSTIAKIVFPPFIPVIIFVDILFSLITFATEQYFATDIHINRLDFEIGLQPGEKITEGIRYNLGLDPSPYLLDLKLAKEANKLTMDQAVETIRPNSMIAAFVFPSVNTSYCNGASDCEGVFYSNQNVSLVSKTEVYVDRSAPTTLKDNQFASILCPPSRGKFISDFSNKSKSFEYLCERAMGIRKNYASDDMFTLVDFLDGNDDFYADNTPTIFIAGDGGKLFVGGSNTDIIQLAQNYTAMTGNFRGGAGDDTLIVSSNCHPDIVLKLKEVRVSTLVAIGRNVHVMLKDFEAVLGRQSVTDEFYLTGCQINMLSGNGGVPSKHDKIHISQANSMQCSRPLTLVAHSYTDIIIKKSLRVIYLVVPSGGATVTDMNVYFQQLPNNDADKPILILNFDGSEAKDLVVVANSRRVNDSSYEMSLYVGGERTITFYNANNGSIFVRTELGVFAQLVRSSEGQVECLTTVHESSDGSGIVSGCPHMRNLFNVFPSDTPLNINGGLQNDVILVNKGHLAPGSKISGSEGIDIVMLHNHLVNSVIFDSVEMLYGRENIGDHVLAWCSLQQINLQGGTLLSSEPDVITIPKGLCKEQDKAYPVMQIHINNLTIVNNNYEKPGLFEYVISNARSLFEIHIANASIAQHVYRVNRWIGDLVSTHVNDTLYTVTFRSQITYTLDAKVILVLDQTSWQTGNEKDNKTVSLSVYRGELFALTILADTSVTEYTGQHNAHNSIFVNASSHSMYKIVGGNLSNRVHLEGLKQIHILQFNDSSGPDELSIGGDICNESIIVDFRDNQINAIVTFDNRTLVNEAYGFNFITGRGGQFGDLLYVGCGDLDVSGFTYVVITDTRCIDSNITVHVAPDTTVSFELAKNDKYYVFHESLTFIYMLEPQVMEFCIEVELNFIIRMPRHVIQLPVSVGDISSFSYDNSNAILSFTTAAGRHDICIDDKSENIAGFFETPEILTTEGFHVRIDINGNVFVSGIREPWDPSDDDAVAMESRRLSENLNATLIVEAASNDSYLVYAGTNETNNYLVNGVAQASLIGAGTVATYIINYLDANIKIYPSPAHNIIDLYVVVNKTREQLNNPNYVPVILAAGNDLHLHVRTNKGKLVIKNGTLNYENIEIIPGVVGMKISKTEDGSYVLKPNPLVISPTESRFVLDIADFEIGTEIDASGIDATLISYVNGSDIIIANDEKSDTALTFVILDADYESLRKKEITLRVYNSTDAVDISTFNY